MKKERVNEIWGVLFLLLGLFALVSLASYDPSDIPFNTSHPSAPIQNVAGQTGAYLAFALFFVCGVSAYLIPALFLLWAGCFFLQQVPEKKLFKVLGLVIALFSAATVVTISVEPAKQFTRGGVIGYLAGSHLLQYFGNVGSYIIAFSCLLLSLLLATDFLLYPIARAIFERIGGFFSAVWSRASEVRENLEDHLEESRKESSKAAKKEKREREREKEKPEPKVSTLPDVPIKVKKYDPSVAAAAEKLKAEAAQESGTNAPPRAEKPKRTRLPSSDESAAGKEDGAEEKTRFDGVIGSKAESESSFNLPSAEDLKRPTGAVRQTDNLQENSRIIEQVLSEFDIEVKVVEVEQGPVITRYELMPAPGVKVNSIASYGDDLALALKSPSVRFIIPIPGKSAVGVEVPNSVSNIVSLREMIESAEFQSKKQILPLVLGKTTSGEAIITDLAGMPHLLIAGSTGSGKTVCVNSIIMGLIFRLRPDQLKFVMIDPKMVELAIYNGLPHMLAPVVTDIKKAASTLNWVVNEMENRYQLFARVGVRNIQSFNERPLSEEAQKQLEAVESENVVPARLPHIIVVIDELADLMITLRDKVETAIQRLAQLARATGIHLILATQRPSVDVITGVIKANFPARLSFKVASKVDSRTVLDANGADQLLGKGDMLFMQPGAFKPVRGQAPLVTDAEINRIVEFLKEQGKPEFHPEIEKVQSGRSLVGAEEKDELFEEAVKIVLETKQASTSNLQRRMRLGYTRAARIIDQMEAEGIIGPQQGAKPREILVSAEDSAPVETAE
ncbi:MAG: DNA translocase FtsK [Candidatus Omnitrophota bacterium]